MKKLYIGRSSRITLGIIGIVAAMTIPNLMNNYTEKHQHLEKAYAEFTQLAKQISYDYEVDTFEEAVRMQEELDNLTPQANVVTQPVINLFNRYFKTQILHVMVIVNMVLNIKTDGIVKVYW